MTDYSRQSFLGPDSDQALEAATIGFGGLGGGGSHAVQQAAHLGIGNFVLVDPDAIEDSNLNRLVGGPALDVTRGTSKVDIAKRLILAITPHANVVQSQSTWQEAIEAMKRVDIIFGGSASISGKNVNEHATWKN